MRSQSRHFHNQNTKRIELLLPFLTIKTQQSYKTHLCPCLHDWLLSMALLHAFSATIFDPFHSARPLPPSKLTEEMGSLSASPSAELAKSFLSPDWEMSVPVTQNYKCRFCLWSIMVKQRKYKLVNVSYTRAQALWMWWLQEQQEQMCSQFNFYWH